MHSWQFVCIHSINPFYTVGQRYAYIYYVLMKSDPTCEFVEVELG